MLEHDRQPIPHAYCVCGFEGSFTEHGLPDGQGVCLAGLNGTVACATVLRLLGHEARPAMFGGFGSLCWPLSPLQWLCCSFAVRCYDIAGCLLCYHYNPKQHRKQTLITPGFRSESKATGTM